MSSKAHEPDFEDRLERSTGALLRGEDPRELSWHPSDNELLAFHAEPRTMEATLRAKIRDHFGGCGSCRDAFEAFSAISAAQAKAPQTARAASFELGSWADRLLAPLQALFAQPALVSAMVAVFAVAGFLALDPLNTEPDAGFRGVEVHEGDGLSADPGTLGPATLTLASGLPNRVEADALSGAAEVVLELLAPAGLPGGAQFPVSLIGPSGELEATATLGEEAPPRVSATFPTERLAPGSYRVLLFAPGAGGAPLAEYTLEVE